MSLIEDIKERLDIVDVIGEKITLRRAGKNYTGLCPFHNEDTPSFVVRPGTQRFRCYGCQAHGDVVEFWEKLNQVDRGEAVRELAQRAGIPMRARGEEDLRAEELRQNRFVVFSEAMFFFQERMASSKDGKRYATEERGWPEAWVTEQAVGWFGKDWNALKAHLKKMQIDLESPAAVALVGYKGDVAAWAKAHGVTASATWISDGKIPAMPPYMLIYPHVWRGQAHYLAGRRVGENGSAVDYVGPKSWNPPEELAGPKQPYFNAEWLEATREAKGKSFLLVEGQGCGVTLAGMELPAAALAGSFDSGVGKQELAKELKRVAAAGGRVVMALDNDEAGIKAEIELAKLLLGEVGLNAVQVARLRWPEKGKDANGWLLEGAGAQDYQQEIEQAQSWLEGLIDEASPKPNEKSDDGAVRAIFDALVGLDMYEVEKWRDEITVMLGIRRRMFDAMLKAARREAGQSDDGQPRFFVEGGRIFTRYYDSGGSENIEPLCNFDASITRDVLRDNGQDVVREFHISGKIGKRGLPVARVRASEFIDMAWTLRDWGSKAIIEPGGRKKDQLRAAIQYLSREVETRTIYAHTGWREIEASGSCAQRVFLSAGGVVGGPGLEVDLPDDLKNYRIPSEADDPAGAMRESLKFLDIAPRRVTLPLWSAVWLAPLCELVNVAFALWVYGGTGAMKSTLAAAALNHYGMDWNDKALPANFIDTDNVMEYKAFIAKDMLLIIDDFTPQKEGKSAQEYTRKAHRIVRDVGNKAGRGRLNSNAEMKATYTPRGLVLITGEDLPESEALVARLFVVEMERGDVDIVKLSAFQAQRARLPHVLSGYVAWLAQNWGGLEMTIPARWQDFRLRAFASGMHLRLPEAVAGLALGMEMGLRYAASLGAISPAEFGEMLDGGWQTILEGAQGMASRVAEEKPELLYCRTLATLLTQGKVYLKHRGEGKPMGGPAERSELIGWYDMDWFYLLPEATYNLVSKYFRDQGNVFPVREQTLRKMLEESGVLSSDKGGRRARSEHLEGRSRRVLMLRRSAFEEPETVEEAEDAEN